MLVDTDSDITINGKEFRGTKGLWELLTRKSVDRRKIPTDDLKNYKKLLELTKANLTDYRPGADIQITRGFNIVTSSLPSSRLSGDVASKQRYVVGGQNTDGSRRRHR